MFGFTNLCFLRAFTLSHAEAPKCLEYAIATIDDLRKLVGSYDPAQDSGCEILEEYV